jgi:hypothetical protein
MLRRFYLRGHCHNERSLMAMAAEVILWDIPLQAIEALRAVAERTLTMISFITATRAKRRLPLTRMKDIY